MAIKSMSLALADAIVVYLTAQQMVNPENFPSGLTWTAERDYMPIMDLSKFATSNPANQPKVYIFPRDDSETVMGIGGSSASEGDYDVSIVVESYVGAPGPGFRAKVDPLMHLRQAIRTLLKPAGVVQPVGIAIANVKLTKIAGERGYEYSTLRDKQIFLSDQVLTFSICPV